MIQHTYILDTNVYGELLIEPDRKELTKKIRENKSYFVYGVNVVERELSKTPIDIKYKGKSARKLLIGLFELLSDEILTVTPLAKHLAEDYFRRYKELAKLGKYKVIKEKYDEENLKIDFQIIAIASIKAIDVVVSSDTRTMLSQLAKDVYAHINRINNLRIPELTEYEKFKEVYLK